ncbi:restriction endonuclease subunit S [Pseudomonas alloputida]|uniref:restriction endonuclease subunit S n=1 Tax=Pseudomonas alloputida TaxID=1940621 RepID=UPI003208DEC0
MRYERAPYKLDQLGFVGRGKSKHRPRNDPSLYGGEYPFFQTGDVKGAELYLRDYSATYNEKGLAQSKLWQPGTLCITIAANIADTSVLSVSGCFPDSVVGFVADPQKSNVFFVKYYLDTLKKAMQSVSHGTTQDNLSLEKLLSFDFWVPPVEEQRKIASVLLAYDDLIDNNTRRIKNLEEMARRLYEEWFVQFRFPGHAGVEFKESELGPIPESWRIAPIKDTYYDLFDGPHATPKKCASGPVFLGIKNIRSEGGLDFSTVQHISENDFPKWTKRVTPQQGDIVFSYEATLNRYAIIPKSFHGCLGRRLALVRPKPFFRSFLYVHFFSSGWREVVARNTLSGATVDRIPLSGFPDFPLLLPPEAIVRKFETFSSPILELIERLTVKSDNLRAQRDLILPKLISGEIDAINIPMPT